MVKSLLTEPLSMVGAYRMLAPEYKPLKLPTVVYDDQLKNMTKKEWLEKFITEICKLHGTDYTSGGQQCKPGKRRSVGDIFFIMRNYYKDLTLKEIRKLLNELILEKKINSLLCPDIKRRVFDGYPRLWMPNNGFGMCAERDIRDEFGWTFQTEEL